MLTNQFTMLWEMAVILYPLTFTFPIPPIFIGLPMILMIVFITNPSVFEDGTIPVDIVTYIKNFGYVLSVSLNWMFFQYQMITPYDHSLQLSYFFLLQLWFIFLYFFNNIFILGSGIYILILYFTGLAFSCRNCAVKSAFNY